MNRNRKPGGTWIGPTVVFALMILTVAFAERFSEQGGGGPDQAQQMAMVIGQGQLNLQDATTLAEKHVQGTALRVACGIEILIMPPAGDRPKPQPNPDPPPAQKPPPGGGIAEEATAGMDPAGGEYRLIYEVCCFASGGIKAVRVDGRSKSVLDVNERRALDDCGNPRP